MTDQELIDFAVKQGFTAAAVVDTGKIVFDPSFRPYCEENLCGQYGVNYTCPPVCGSPEEMKQRITAHKKALVVESIWEVTDYSDKPAIKHGKSMHNKMEIEVLKHARQNGTDGFLVGASGCSLCSPCAMKAGEPCRFPDLRWSCMSAYCIFVKKLADLCGMEYDPGAGLVSFYGMFVYG